MKPSILTIMLAGGAGERLHPLTSEIAKPAVPFGGGYRIVDITLSNCINSGLRQIYILTQHKALTLNRHIRQAWNILSPEVGEIIEVLPPTRRVGVGTWEQRTRCSRMPARSRYRTLAARSFWRPTTFTR